MASRITPAAVQAAMLPYGTALTTQSRGLAIIATVEGQELHVSVSRADRYPTWAELKRVKELFWHPEADVIQFLPPASEYVNLHENCFHMYGDLEGVRRWRLSSPLEIQPVRIR